MNQIIEQLIPLADAHQQADEYVSGTYGDSSTAKACAIGCTINDARKIGLLNGVENCDHVAIAQATGVPEIAWRMLDHCFEGLAETDRPALTPLFLRAAAIGRSHDTLAARIVVRLMTRLAAEAMVADVRASAEVVADLYRRRARGDEPAKEQWDAARQQAYAAWKQADAARQQAYAARRQADAARQQADAAWQQADAARQQVDAAQQQAYAAQQQAYAAWQQWWVWCADMLCEEVAK